MSKKKSRFKFKYKQKPMTPEEKEKLHQLALENRFSINGVVCEDKDGEILLRNIPINRNPSWQPLDWKYISSICGVCSRFEHVMCENQCKDEDTAIRAIFNSRKALEDLSIYLSWKKREEQKEKYIRTHYNDLEEDNYERQEERMLNG